MKAHLIFLFSKKDIPISYNCYLATLLLLNEAEKDMKNYSADQGGCYPPRPKAEVDNTLQDRQNSSYPSKAEFNNSFIIYSKYFKLFENELFLLTKNNETSFPGFVSQSTVQ